MIQGAATVSTASGPAFTRYVRGRRDADAAPVSVAPEEKTEKVFGIELPLSVARSEREMASLKDRMVKVARIFSQNYSIEVLPSPNGSWSIEVDSDASRYGREYVSGVRNSIQDIPEEKFRAKKIFYDVHTLIGASEEEVLIRLRHQVGRIQNCDVRNYFEGQRIAKAEGALPSTWLSLHNALDECWVDTKETLTSEESRAKIAELHKRQIHESQLRISGEPLTRQFTENLRYYWVHNKMMPEIKSKIVIEAFEKVRLEVEKYFYSKTHAEAFNVLKDSIWPVFKNIEKEARREESLREAARKASGLPLGEINDGGISGNTDLLALWDNDELLKISAQNEKRKRETLFSQHREENKERAKLNVLRNDPEGNRAAEKSGTTEKVEDREKKAGKLGRMWRRIKKFFGAKPKDEQASPSQDKSEETTTVEVTLPTGPAKEASSSTGKSEEEKPSGLTVSSNVEAAALENHATSAGHSNPSNPPSSAKAAPAAVAIPVQQEQPALSAEEASQNLAKADSDLKAAVQPTHTGLPNNNQTTASGVKGVDLTNSSTTPPTPAPSPTETLTGEITQQIEEAARRIEIDKLKRTPVVTDIDLKRLSAESSQVIIKYLDNASAETKLEIEENAARKLELKQSRALLFEMPKHMQVDARTVVDEGGATIGFSTQPSYSAVRTVQENVERFIVDYEKQEETKRAEKIRIEGEQLAQALRQEREKRDMERKGFSQSEVGLYKQFMDLEFEMRGRIQSFMSQVGPLLPKGESYVFDGAHYTGKRFNKQAIARYAPLGDMRLYSRRKTIEGETPQLAVQLLIDNSGSMENPPVKLQGAIKTAIFFGRVLRDFGIPFSIKLFAEGVEQIKAIDQDYDKPDLRIKHSLITKANAQGGGTNMHLPLQQAHAELVLLKRKDPSMSGAVFIISDSGANQGVTKTALRNFIESMRRDCTVTNFILSQNPEEVTEAKSYFGAQNVVAPQSFEELPDEAIRVLRRTMERAFQAQAGFRR